MRTRSYTLHPGPDAIPGEAHGLDRAQVVADGFSWPAFAFSVAWFAFHRLWLAALIVAAGLALVALAGYALGIAPGAAFVITLLASVLIGLEASSLRRWTLARHGRPARDAVQAASLAEAEAKLIARWLDPRSLPPAPQRPAFARDREPVIGLFPAEGGGR
ncbi:DUF2628 domain-containing protein [Methylobacterium dankookense]|uniref:DUF2628 domain-containing protein n=1 Tax=Methylobacterium dankookense TaxID=560405 RepID=A0A564G280_9HYPH|nr:DUF2628 domain-containing protein [Methylobacterium dankookense]GJD56948.1 hypothetical protein IFDJLNFL_2846 [Methylobacterium dankookense]VUF14545.1 hypothetical protein MTDSW087_04270 [Methylobacterium dankookense]